MDAQKLSACYFVSNFYLILHRQKYDAQEGSVENPTRDPSTSSGKKLVDKFRENIFCRFRKKRGSKKDWVRGKAGLEKRRVWKKMFC